MGLQIINRSFTDYQNRTLSFPFFQGWDFVTAKYTLQVDFSVQISISNQLLVSGTTLSLTNGNWEDFGFFAGADIVGSYGTETIPSGSTVDYVDGGIMTIILGSGSLTDGTYDTGLITCDEIPNAFEFEFNLVPNTSGAENQFSLIDGEVNRFSVLTDGMAILDPAIDFTRIGANFSGGSIMNASIDRLADISGKQVFEISVSFKNWTVKDLGLFLTANCVKPWIRIKVFPEYQNPTVSIDITNTPSDAQTGAFNEVGNGGIPDYSLESISWENEDAESLPTFDYSQPSIFTAIINGVFTSGSKFNLAWYFDSVDDADYKNLPLPIDNNLMLVTKTSPFNVGATASFNGESRADGALLRLSDILITQDGTSATFTGKFTPTNEFVDFIESKESFNRNFRLAIRVENPSLTDNFIRPVWLDVDSQIMTKQIIPLGVYDIVNYSLFGHDGTLNPTRLIIEDDFRTVTTFTLPRNNTFESIELGCVVYELGTSNNFTLESVICNLSGFPTLIDGSKPINQIINLPINLSPTNPNKQIIFEREESLDDVDNYGVKVTYSSVINWKYWQEQVNANIVFFPNQNKDWLNYQNSDWKVLFALRINAENGQYENGFLLNLRDYDDWEGSTVWEYFKEDLTPITKPLIDEITIIKATHTNIISFDDEASYWGQMTVEPGESNPRWDISSVYDTLPNPSSPLIPLVGEDRLKLVIDGDTMETWCRFDPSKLSNPLNISFTSRIYNELPKDDTLAEVRNKVTTKTVKLPKDTTNEPRLDSGNCCDCIWDVFADEDSNDSWKNHISSRWATGETVTFQLYKDGVLSDFQPTAQDFPNDVDSKYCTIPWKDVLISDGQGCYTLKATIEVAGLDFERTLGVFNLQKFDWFVARTKVMIRSVFNDANMREEINFTNANVIDCIMFDGDIEEFQPNTEISNLTFSDFSQNKIKRENLTSWSVNVNPSGYCLINRLVNIHLVGENKLFVTDYRYNAFDKTILDKPCILSESPQMTPLYTSERQKSTFKIQEKVVNNLTKYGSVTASGDVNAEQLLYPNTVSETGGDVEAKVYNTNEELIVTQTVSTEDPEIVFPDTEITLKDSGGTTISTTDFASGVSNDLTAPDGAITVNGSSVGNVKSNGSRALLVKYDGVQDGTFDGVNTINLSSAWKRNPDWLALDTVTSGSEKFSGLFAVYETLKNVCTIQITTGTRTIDWGDGTTQSATSGTLYTKVYDYSTISSIILTDEFGNNYKMVVVNIPMTSATQLYIDRNTSATLINNGRSLNWLDVAVDCSTMTLFAPSGQAVANKLERMLIYNVGATLSGTTLFIYMNRLKVIRFPFAKLTSVSTTFYPYFGDVRDESNLPIDIILTGATTSLVQLFEFAFLSMVGVFSAPTATSGQKLFFNNTDLIEITSVNLPLATNLVSMFEGDVNLESIIPITISSSCTSIASIGQNAKKCRGFNFSDCSGIVNTTSAFSGMVAMETLILTGMTRGFTIDDCNMSATAIDALFTSLGPASGSQTINVRRNPGSATCTTSIATGKGYTVVIA